MFGKMVNRYYYGKSGKGDFTPEDLPTTRWQLFWEMLRVRFGSLFKLNMMYMVFWLPAIFIIGRAVSMAYGGLATVTEMQMQLEAGEVTLEAFQQMNDTYLTGLKAIAMQTLLMLVPAIAITGPASAGLSYITRNWARDEHAFVWSDFWEVLAANWKQGLMASTITGFVPLLAYVCFTFYGQMANDNLLFMIPQAVVIMICTVWMMSLMYLYPQMVTYDLNFRGLVRNSFIMAVGRLPATLGLKLLSLLPLVICLAVSFLTPYAQFALLFYGIYYVVIGYALSRFVQCSYANGVFDKFLNEQIEGAEVGRGLYAEEDDEDEQPSDASVEG